MGARNINTHEVEGNELNEFIEITVMDEPGPGGASHEYTLEFPAKCEEDPSIGEMRLQYIRFQKGPVKEAGINGLSDEALLAVLIDRATGFAEGPFPCTENDEALYHLKKALEWKQKRTRTRIERGVEGTMQK